MSACSRLSMNCGIHRCAKECAKRLECVRLAGALARGKSGSKLHALPARPRSTCRLSGSGFQCWRGPYASSQVDGITCPEQTIVQPNKQPLEFRACLRIVAADVRRRILGGFVGAQVRLVTSAATISPHFQHALRLELRSARSHCAEKDAEQNPSSVTFH